MELTREVARQIPDLDRILDGEVQELAPAPGASRGIGVDLQLDPELPAGLVYEPEVQDFVTKAKEILEATKTKNQVICKEKLAPINVGYIRSAYTKLADVSIEAYKNARDSNDPEAQFFATAAQEALSEVRRKQEL